MVLDDSCLLHYQLPTKMERDLFALIAINVITHNIIYGNINREDPFNWAKNAEVASIKVKNLFENYPGGRECQLFQKILWVKKWGIFLFFCHQ